MRRYHWIARDVAYVPPCPIQRHVYGLVWPVLCFLRQLSFLGTTKARVAVGSTSIPRAVEAQIDETGRIMSYENKLWTHTFKFDRFRLPVIHYIGLTTLVEETV